MKRNWIITIILWLVGSIVFIYSLLPLPENSTFSGYILIGVPFLGLLTMALVWGITKEMKQIFGSEWRRPFFLFMGCFYLIVGVLPQLLTLAFQIKALWIYQLWFFLSLPICYIALVLYRKFLMKNKGVLRNE